MVPKIAGAGQSLVVKTAWSLACEALSNDTKDVAESTPPLLLIPADLKPPRSRGRNLEAALILPGVAGHLLG